MKKSGLGARALARLIGMFGFEMSGEIQIVDEEQYTPLTTVNIPVRIGDDTRELPVATSWKTTRTRTLSATNAKVTLTRRGKLRGAITIADPAMLGEIDENAPTDAITTHDEHEKIEPGERGPAQSDNGPAKACNCGFEFTSDDQKFCTRCGTLRPGIPNVGPGTVTPV